MDNYNAKATLAHELYDTVWQMLYGSNNGPATPVHQQNCPLWATATAAMDYLADEWNGELHLTEIEN